MTTQNYYRPINIELASPKYSDHMRQKSTLGQLLQKTSRARPACVIPSPRISKLRKGNPGSLGDRSLALAVPPKTLYVSSLRHNSMIYENQMSQNHNSSKSERSRQTRKGLSGKGLGQSSARPEWPSGQATFLGSKAHLVSEEYNYASSYKNLPPSFKKKANPNVKTKKTRISLSNYKVRDIQSFKPKVLGSSQNKYAIVPNMSKEMNKKTIISKFGKAGNPQVSSLSKISQAKSILSQSKAKPKTNVQLFLSNLKLRSSDLEINKMTSKKETSIVAKEDVQKVRPINGLNAFIKSKNKLRSLIKSSRNMKSSIEKTNFNFQKRPNSYLDINESFGIRKYSTVNNNHLNKTDVGFSIKKHGKNKQNSYILEKKLTLDNLKHLRREQKDNREELMNRWRKTPLQNGANSKMEKLVSKVNGKNLNANSKKKLLSNMIKREISNIENKNTLQKLLNQKKKKSGTETEKKAEEFKSVKNLNLFEPKFLKKNAENPRTLKLVYSNQESLKRIPRFVKVEKLSLNFSLNAGRYNTFSSNLIIDELNKKKQKAETFILPKKVENYSSIRRLNEYDLKKKSLSPVKTSAEKTSKNQLNLQKAKPKIGKFKSLEKIKSIDSKLKIKKPEKIEIEKNVEKEKEKGLSEKQAEKRPNRFETLPPISHFTKKKPSKSILKKHKSAR